MRYEILHADCRDVLANMGDATVDSIVTDPPYHLTSIVKRFGKEGSAPAQFGTDGAYARASRGFMGKEWDGGDIAFDPALWAECLRVLKPGGHLLAFSGSRTYHRMAYAIDLAGFEIRDQLLWLYGSGFPKSHDVSKAIDKAAGAEREVVGDHPYAGRASNAGQQFDGFTGDDVRKLTAPATPEAQQWEGWGTALKPAHEPIVMARKPLDGTVAENVLAYGTGALNIDACRVPADPNADASQMRVMRRGDRRPDGYGMGATENAPVVRAEGRFPANVLHDGSDAIVGGFPETTSGGLRPEHGMNESTGWSGGSRPGRIKSEFAANSGSAARFFYCAKASKADREAGCAILADGDRGNSHPTVKPTELMRWLVRLVTPPGGLVFDPFTGSGSTGRAAMLEGFRFLGAEMTDEYVPIAHARILDALD